MKHPASAKLSRRNFLQVSAAGAAAYASPGLAAAPPIPNLYTQTLRTWCDGLLAQQLTHPNPAFNGALLCPACVLIHGRCGDAMYPLLHMAHATGNPRYLRAATALYDWTEANVSRADGSWINDVTLSSWQGITVFHTIALAESLHHHGSILSAQTRAHWTTRLAAAAKFLDGFISIETGNINYPITACHAFALCGVVLNEPRYTARATTLAQSTLDYFTPNGLLYGEGHPLNEVTKKGCRPVDLGYNVEESLPALAQYALLTGDQPSLDRVVSSLQAHLQFMLPDGAWDNSWGTRNYKWSYWGSRTSDGCQPAFVLLSDKDSRFREAALRNLELMSACTHAGLLYGGPRYFAHGDRPCIHHTFTHAKALATVLDSEIQPIPATRTAIPRDAPSGLQHYPEIGTYLASIGPWRATVTENDFEYIERVQAGGGGETGGGHASGGALSMLFHQALGPVLAASMTNYQLIEISNQQVHLPRPHMTLTPRVELIHAGKTYTSLPDTEARLTAAASLDDIHFAASGELETTSHQPSGIACRLQYTLTPTSVTLVAIANGELPPDASLRFILPIVSPATEAVSQLTANIVRIAKPKGALTLRTDSAFATVPAERTFNLVPGLEAIPLRVALTPGVAATITIET